MRLTLLQINTFEQHNVFIMPTGTFLPLAVDVTWKASDCVYRIVN